MSKKNPAEDLAIKGPLKLVPRLQDQGYDEGAVDERRQWLEEVTETSLPTIGSYSIPSLSMRGNIENPIGAAQVPLAVAGPIQVLGKHAHGRYYVPFATTEGALVRSYERGMVAITRAGGAQVHISSDGNVITPTFICASLHDAVAFTEFLQEHFATCKEKAESTTRFGKLQRIECRLQGRRVLASFFYHTGDAQGMNMIAKATDHCCQWIMTQNLAQSYQLFSGMSSEKRASGFLLSSVKGKTVTASALIPASLTRAYLHATPEEIHNLWQSTVLGHLHAGSLGYCGHLANGLTAIFIACGQDVANVVNAATGVTHFEVTEDGDLFASVHLPSLTVATVGGGVGLATAKECLSIMDCFGTGKANKFAEIIAAALLGGEISMAAAIVSGEFVNAHETFGRNRPEE